MGPTPPTPASRSSADGSRVVLGVAVIVVILGAIVGGYVVVTDEESAPTTTTTTTRDITDIPTPGLPSDEDDDTDDSDDSGGSSGSDEETASSGDGSGGDDEDDSEDGGAEPRADTNGDTPVDIVHAFFDAMSSGECERAMSYVSDHYLDVAGYESRDDVVQACEDVYAGGSRTTVDDATVAVPGTTPDDDVTISYTFTTQNGTYTKQVLISLVDDAWKFHEQLD